MAIRNSKWTTTAFYCYNLKFNCEECFYKKTYDTLGSFCCMKETVENLLIEVGEPIVKGNLLLTSNNRIKGNTVSKINYKDWMKDETELCFKLHRDGVSKKIIAGKLGRTYPSVAGKISKMIKKREKCRHKEEVNENN